MASLDPRFSRRRVLVGAAWAAPVILLATSAPARAASQPDTLAMGALSSVTRDGDEVSAGVAVTTTGDDALAVTLRVSYPVDAVDASAPSSVEGGWSAVSADPAARQWVYQVTIGPGDTVPFRATKAGAAADAFSIRFTVLSVTGGDPVAVEPPAAVVVEVPAA